VELVSADVDRHDLSGAPLEHTVGEATRRTPNVDDTSASGIDMKSGERSIELLAGSTHELRSVTSDLNRFGRVDHARRFRSWRASDGHPTLLDQLTGTGSTRHETSSNQLGVETATSSHRSAQSVGDERQEVVGGCDRCRFDRQVSRLGHPAKDETEVVPDRLGETAVGVGPITHHQAAISQLSTNESSDRFVRLAGHDRFDAGGNCDRPDDRTVSRE